MVFQYTIEKIDIDGDGIPDGDLVSQWKLNRKGERVLVSRKFVPIQKIKEIVDNIPKTPKAKTIRTYKKAIPSEPTTAPVQIQDKTEFVQYIKQGAGTQIGRIAVDSLAGALGDMFSWWT